LRERERGCCVCARTGSKVKAGSECLKRRGGKGEGKANKSFVLFSVAVHVATLGHTHAHTHTQTYRPTQTNWLVQWPVWPQISLCACAVFSCQLHTYTHWAWWARSLPGSLWAPQRLVLTQRVKAILACASWAQQCEEESKRERERDTHIERAHI